MNAYTKKKDYKNDAMLTNIFVKEQVDAYVTLYNHVHGLYLILFELR